MQAIDNREVQKGKRQQKALSVIQGISRGDSVPIKIINMQQCGFLTLPSVKSTIRNVIFKNPK